MDVSIIITFASIFIAALSCCVAIIGALRNAQHDASDMGGQFNEIMTKLDFLGEDIRDIKSELRNTDKRVDDVRDIAMSADRKAEDALRRLKQLGG